MSLKPDITVRDVEKALVPGAESEDIVIEPPQLQNEGVHDIIIVNMSPYQLHDDPAVMLPGHDMTEIFIEWSHFLRIALNLKSDSKVNTFTYT